MNRFFSLLKKLVPSAIQISIVAALILTAFLAFNMGAATHAGHAEGENIPAPAAVADDAAHPADLNRDGVIYTCSMHPQIQQDEPGNCPICGMELVPMEVGTAAKQDHERAAEPTLIGYACAMNCVPPLPEPGPCPVCGMEMQPVYEDGAAEKAGEMPQLTMSKEAAALAKIKTAEATLQTPIKHIRLVGQLSVDPSRRAHISANVGGRIDKLEAKFEGDIVQKGEELVRLYSPELLAVQQEFLQARRSLARLGPETLPSIRNASESAVEAARERLRLAGLSLAHIDEIAAADEAREQVSLEAPIGGTVITRDVEEGEYVGKGARILTIADLSVLWAEMQAYESDLPWLRVDQPVTFTSEAFPGKVFNGEVAWIDPMTDVETRTTRVRLNVENEDALLRPGMYITANVEAALDHGPVLVIPESAPLLTGTRAIVYTMDMDSGRPEVSGREVVLGPRIDDGYVVVSGLEEGDRVVTHGAFQIDSELQIRAKTSMMNPSPKHEHTTEQVLDSIPESELSALLPAYLEVQRALASDDFDTAKAAWRKLQKIATSIPVKAFHDELHNGSESTDINALRAAFEPVSERLIALVREYGNPLDKALQLTHCPMALEWKGAHWLQSEDDVFNPYFGDEMLTCGQIMQEWQPRD